MYNLPSAPEIARVIPESNSNGSFQRDVILQSRSGKLKRISDLNAHYDPMHYVLMFPKGDLGWYPDMQSLGTKQKVTLMEYFQYRF